MFFVPFVLICEKWQYFIFYLGVTWEHFSNEEYSKFICWSLEDLNSSICWQTVTPFTMIRLSKVTMLGCTDLLSVRAWWDHSPIQLLPSCFCRGGLWGLSNEMTCSKSCFQPSVKADLEMRSVSSQLGCHHHPSCFAAVCQSCCG